MVYLFPGNQYQGQKKLVVKNLKTIRYAKIKDIKVGTISKQLPQSILDGIIKHKNQKYYDDKKLLKAIRVELRKDPRAGIFLSSSF
jgi:hypothetical protein